MKSPYVSELEPNKLIVGLFLVQNKEIRQKKTGEPYLSLTLADRTGDLDAKMWDNVVEAMDLFERDGFIKVKGIVQLFQNKPQLTIHKLVPVPESEIDIADFLPASKRSRDEMFAELRQWIGSMTNPHLKTLLETIFADETLALAYRTAPAAKAVHHAWIGGLIEHVLSLCHLAKFTSSHYPDVDFDLLLTGVLLHDIGKTSELTYARSLGYSSEGQLIGHIVIGVQMVDEFIKKVPGFPPRLRDLVMHMILSHHGVLEFGSPKVPSFLEAMLLHQIDTLDSKMECMRASVEKERFSEAEWTGWIGPLERTVLKKKKYLDPASAANSKAPGAPTNQTAPAAVSPTTAPPTAVLPTAGLPTAATPAAALNNHGNGPKSSSSPFAAKLEGALKQHS
ncbi:MAG: HD domain-containing protein [Bryobacteraceae bacterium]